MKAFWLLICPLAYFVHGPIDPSGTFCQVSGFFLTASIEAADIAVLMIAIHTALSLIRPQPSSSDTGLYPYRRCAYLCWAVVPLVLAGIVPLTGSRFNDDGPNCYLPANPTWYRLMLSWVPRYIIFLAIFLTYVGIYAYVRFQLARFCRDQRRASNQSMTSSPGGCFCESSPHPHPHHYQRRFLQPRYPDRKRHNSNFPATPSIAQHGLLDNELSGASPAIGEYRDRQVSAGSTISTLKLEKQPQQQHQPAVPKPARLAYPHRISWRPIQFSQDAPPETPLWSTISTVGNTGGASDLTRTHSNATTAVGIQATARDAPSAAHEGLSPRTSVAPSLGPSAVHAARSLWRRSIDQTGASARSVAGSLYNIVEILRLGPARQAGMASSTNTSPGDVYLPTDETEETIRRSRDRIERQLRLLFVYPAIYVLTWIAPLVANATGFDNSFSREMRYWEDASDFRPGTDGTNGTWHNGPMVATGGVDDTTGMGTGSAPSPSTFGLEIATLVSLCIGAAVDCCFFSAWEKPWRHPRRRSVGFLSDLATCLHLPTSASGSSSSATDRRRSLLGDCDFLSHRRNGSGGSGSWMGLGRRVRPGRTREEQNRDARLAHLRRDQEVLDRAARARERERERARAAIEGADGDAGVPVDGGENGMARDPRREWWDAIDVDAEEDPFERRRHGAADDIMLDARLIGGGGGRPASH